MIWLKQKPAGPNGLPFYHQKFSGPATNFLAGIDRMDKDLTVGKLQGKFQNQVL